MSKLGVTLRLLGDNLGCWCHPLCPYSMDISNGYPFILFFPQPCWSKQPTRCSDFRTLHWPASVDRKFEWGNDDIDSHRPLKFGANQPWSTHSRVPGRRVWCSRFARNIQIFRWYLNMNIQIFLSFPIYILDRDAFSSRCGKIRFCNPSGTCPKSVWCTMSFYPRHVSSSLSSRPDSSSSELHTTYYWTNKNGYHGIIILVNQPKG